jgi:3-deoxy-D-manno-octulosonic-acid transferase
VPRTGDEQAVMIHAVSLGEINATRALVKGLAEARADLRFIVSAGTETGFERGKQLYGADPRVTLIRYPLDFSGAVGRVLDGLRPSVVVLMELEVWPNWMVQCQKRNILVVLVNGRLTPGSYRGYRWLGPVSWGMFGRLAGVCAQEQVYAGRFVGLGVKRDRVVVTGTMKFDTAEVADRVEGDRELAEAVGLRPGEERIWVCGSTGDGEEAIVLGLYRKLLERFPGLRLVIVPRKPERFDGVAQQIADAGFRVFRRSSSALTGTEAGPVVILGDTMGELRKFYSLSDVVFVGRTLVDQGERQHGSDMIEPAALGKPVIVGRWTGNFTEVMNALRRGEGIKEITSGEELGRAMEGFMVDPESGRAMGRRAQEVVASQKGATGRHIALILRYL